MKKTLIILAYFILTNFLFGQAPNRNWEKVLELDDKLIYVDTTNIKKVESQISAIGLSISKLQSQTKNNVQEIYAVKTNVIFDTELKKYSVIGTLYYDRQWKIIGETSSPGRSINSALFGSSIDTNKVLNAIYNKCLDYLSKNSVDDKKNKVNVTSNIVNRKEIQPAKEISNTSKDKREALTEKFIDKKLSEESKPDLPVNTSQKQNTNVKPIESHVSRDYDLANDKNVRGTIFTDGKKFSFQLSSWKNRQQAEAEVNRLISAGHNAFLVEAYLPNKGGNWYRVRIGYFDSIADAERYRRNMR